MEKTECMGKCPVYKVDFYNDGSVLYTGKKNVLREGDMKFNLKQSELSEIKNKAEALNFFELQDKYIADVTDLPTTILVYNSGEREKTVVDYYNAPNKLKEFEERLEEIVFSYL